MLPLYTISGAVLAKPPSRSSPPNRRNHAEREGGTDEAGSSKVWLGNFLILALGALRE
jgi:hypothetical protein